MARQILTPITLPAVTDLDGTLLVWTAAIVADKEKVKLTGNEIVLVRNVDAGGAHTVTVSAVDCDHGRTQTCIKSIALSSYHVFQRFPLAGWVQTDGYLYMEADNVNIEYCVLRLR